MHFLACAATSPPGTGDRVVPTLRRAGYPLLVSNNPETVSSAPAALAIFTRLDPAGTPIAGRFRVYLHHLNASPAPIDVVVAVHNRAFPGGVDLFASKRTRFTPVNPSPAAAAAGANAFITWAESSPADVRVALIAPGQIVYPEVAATTVPAGAVVSGYFDFLATVAGGPLPAPVRVYVLALPVGLRPAAAPAACAPRDRTRPTANIRGAFRHSGRVMTARIDTAQGAQYLAIAPPFTGAYGLPQAGEYEQGFDECDGIPVCVNGNYGVDYRVSLLIAGGAGVGRVRLAAQTPNLYCAEVHFALALQGATASCAVPVPTAWPYADVVLPERGLTLLQLWTTVAGGSCAPVRHWLWPA